MTHQSVTERLERQVTRHLFGNLFNGIVVTAVATTLMAVSVSIGPLAVPSVSGFPVLIWCLLSFSALAFRYAVFRAYSREDRTVMDSIYWLDKHRLGAGLSGLCWGLGGMILLKEAPFEVSAFVLLVIGAMSVGAIPYLAPDRKAYGLFLLGVLCPIILWGIADLTQTSVSISAYAVLFGVGMWQSAKRYEHLMITSLRLRIESDSLNADFARVNCQLEGELAHRIEASRQLQQARNTAEAANRAKTVFLSRMSHELRTPLNAVLGFSELLSMMSSSDLTKNKEEYLGKIKGSGQHLLSLIEDILDVTGIDDGRITIREQEIRLGDLVDECIEMLDSDLAASTVTLEVDESSNRDLLISSDRVRLRQILLNLIGNAIKYNKTMGHIHVDYRAIDDGRIRIEVADTGIGIDSADLELVFQPFIRLPATARSVEGTGIGLTITKQLIELMGGSIDVSTEVNSGTKFTVILPRRLPAIEESRATGT